MGRRALITGATGFVGSHLAERLAADGWEVRALVRSSSDTTLLRSLGAELYEGDLTDPASIARASAGADAVFHLAALTAARDEAGYHRANVEGTRAVVRGLAGADPRPRRLVYLSSYAACGPAANGGPRALAEEPAPLTAYGRTKLAGEAEAGRAAEGGTTAVVVRSPAVYGPRDRALLPYFRLVRWGVAPLPGDGERRLHMFNREKAEEMLARLGLRSLRFGDPPPAEEDYPLDRGMAHTVQWYKCQGWL
jgi:dihydroflavonol-4-reductase